MRSRPQDRGRDEMAYSHHIGIAATDPRYLSSPHLQACSASPQTELYMRTLLSLCDDSILVLR